MGTPSLWDGVAKPAFAACAGDRHRFLRLRHQAACIAYWITFGLPYVCPSVVK